jgi:hypothetical protein
MDHSTLTSNKKFGFLFSGIFCLVGCFNYQKGATNLTLYCWFFFSFIVAMVSITAPELLAKPNKAWFLLGEALGKFVSPLVLGAIFFLLITPIGLITRIFGRDELRLHKGSGNSYWIERGDLAELDNNSFKNQF